MKKQFRYIGQVIFYFTILLLEISCQSYDFRYELVGTDTIELIFYEDKDTTMLEFKSAINQLIASISKEKIRNPKCEYSGKIIFHKARVHTVLLEMDFSIQKNFAYVRFRDKANTIQFRKIDTKGLKLLFTIKKYSEVLETFIE